MSHPLEHIEGGGISSAICQRDEGYTPLATEKAGVSMPNPTAELVTKLMCNRCGAVLDAPAVEHPAREPGFRAP